MSILHLSMLQELADEWNKDGPNATVSLLFFNLWGRGGEVNSLPGMIRAAG